MWCGFLDTLAICLCDVSLLDVVAVETLLLADFEDFEIFDDLEDFDATVDTTELWDDLLCSLWDSWSKALMACNLEELDSDINDW